MNEICLKHNQDSRKCEECLPFVEEEKRTLAQNRALHKYFQILADTLNDAGYEMVKTSKAMKEGVEIPWSRESVKELWRYAQKLIYKKQSTTQLLKREEIDMIHMTLSRFLAEKLQIEPPPFPSEDELAIKSLK